MRGKVSEERKLKEERRGKVKGRTVGTEWGQGGERRRETRERRGEENGEEISRFL